MVLNFYYSIKGERVHLRAFVLRDTEFEECGRMILSASEFLDLVRVQVQADYFDEEQCPPPRSQQSPN